MNDQINSSSKRTAAIFSTNHEMSLTIEAPLEKKNVKLKKSRTPRIHCFST